MSTDISPILSCNWHSLNQFRCTFSPTSSSLSVLRLLGFPPVKNKESSLRTILRGAVQIRLSKNPKKAIGIGYIQTMHESNHSHQYHQYHDWHQFHVILKRYLAADNDSYISTKYPVHPQKIKKSRNLILIQGRLNIISGERDDIITVYVLLRRLV